MKMVLNTAAAEILNTRYVALSTLERIRTDVRSLHLRGVNSNVKAPKVEVMRRNKSIGERTWVETTINVSEEMLAEIGVNGVRKNMVYEMVPYANMYRLVPATSETLPTSPQISVR